MYEGGMYMSVVLCSVTSGYVPCLCPLVNQRTHLHVKPNPLPCFSCPCFFMYVIDLYLCFSNVLDDDVMYVTGLYNSYKSSRLLIYYIFFELA